MFIKLQLFAHKKGMGSTKTDARAKANAWAQSVRTVNLQKQETFSSDNAARTSTPATTWALARTTRCLRSLTAS